MTLFRKALPGLYDGVSQQSATMRTPLQCEAQVNAWATIADGLQKRPPSEHLTKVSETPFGTATIHHINRDTSERYIVIATDGDLRVFDHMTGQELDVSFPYGKGYLNCTDAAKDYALVTVADYTFVVNRTVPVSMEPDATIVDDSEYRWLNRAYAEDGSYYPGSVRQYDYATSTSDSYMGEKQRFEDLPDTATHGQIYKITGSGDNSFSAYYVKRVGGVWEEYRDPGLTTNRINAATMPHALVREASGSFTFAPFSWAERKVGDEISNPAPTFVGRHIRDVFFVQNRLGFLIDENVVLSCAADFGNFWRNTVTAYVASDTVDVAVTGASISLLYHAMPFNDTVVLFSDQTQFVLSWGQEGITPDSVALTPVTQYSVNILAKPVQSGRDVYFASNSAGYSRVYEYYNRPGDGAQTEAADITAHVPRYIPKDIVKLAAATTEEAIFAVPGTLRNRLYVYKYVWGSAQEKAQSSWSYWEFDPATTILSTVCLDSYVYLLNQRPDGVFLERINLQSLVPSFGLDHTVYLDRQVSLTGTYDAGNDRTIFTLPYVYDPTRIRVVQGAAAPIKEALLDPTQYVALSATQLAVPGNRTAYSCVLGYAYEMRYTFSAQFASTDSGAILTGRTILRSMTVRYTTSAFFRTEVSPYGAAPDIEAIVPAKLAEFTGKTLGSSALVLGTPVYGTGDYTFQVYGEAEIARVSLTNDTHVASTFQSAETEITYHNRAR